MNDDRSSGPLRVVVVGQTPPPHHGQAVGIQSFVTGSYAGLALTHVRMGFSTEIGQVGRFRFTKLLHLVGVIARTLWARLATRADVLYYPPAGSDLVPVLRDIAILLATRWAYRQTVFHFHAAGLADAYPRLPRLARAAFRRAYDAPDLAILPAPRHPSDATFVHARKVVVVPYGVPDTPFVRPDRAPAKERPVVLYVGALRESKGVLDLLAAVSVLRDEGLECELQFMGEFSDEAFRQTATERVRALRLDNRVAFLGVRTGQEKDETFAGADIFCFPTRYESETFGIVVIEAMRAGLPVVASDWRGLPSLVDDGDTGFLVPIRDVDALADRLGRLVKAPDERAEMGRRGRAVYLERFTEAHFRKNMEAALTALVASID